MIADFHTHILPGIDDGSDSVECSIEMLKQEAEQGISHVVATPHFYAHCDRPEEFLLRRAEAAKQLHQRLEQHSGLPGISLGAEVYYFRGISETEFLPRLTLQGSNCILVEMPPAPWPETAFAELEQLWEKRGLMPVIAHIDRYISPFRTYDIPRRLAGLPLMVQANASFFLRRSTSTMAMRLLKEDWIQLLGSDCHDLTSRKPNLGAAVEKIRRKLGESALERIARNQRQILPESSVFICAGAHENEWS